MGKKDNNDANIVLVAHGGSTWAHEILANGLHNSRLLASAANVRICDSVIAFKLMPVGGQPVGRPSADCKLKTLAVLKAKYPQNWQAINRVQSLREVSQTALTSMGFTPPDFWRRAACQMYVFASRINAPTRTADDHDEGLEGLGILRSSMGAMRLAA